MTPNDFGRATEARFMLDAMTQGLLVSKPAADLPGYDAVVDCKGRLHRVQIKGSRASPGRCRAAGARVYRVNTNRRRRRVRYDVLAVWLHDDSAWLFIRKRDVKGTRQLTITVGGQRPAPLNNWTLFTRQP